MASSATIGDLLDGSGWTRALAQANIATPGTAESFLKTRHAHQVTANALSILLHTAYDAYSCQESEPKSFDEWCVNRVEISPQSLNDDCMSVLEAFVVLSYDDHTCTETTVNLARKHIFTTKGRSMDNLPPTRAALLQLTKRAVYQGGYVWGQALVR